MTITALSTTSTVRVDGDLVLFDGFVDADSHVVDAVRCALDPETCARELLHLGARLSGLATGVGSLTELEGRVGARLDALAGTAQDAVTDGLATLAEHSRNLFAADDGEVATALRAWRADLDTHLGDMFDPAHKHSVIATMEAALGAVLEVYGRKLTAATDPDVAESPAARLLKQVRDNAADVKAELAALAVAIGAERGRAAEHARTAVKGAEFEPLVLDAVTRIAAPHGDLVEHVGRARGAKATSKGDICVTLCDDDVPSGAGRYVIEVKDRRLTHAATWKELDAAMANWEAGAGIAVFAAGDLAPTDLPFWYSGERAVVVLERDEPDPSALALACLFARWVVRRRWAPTGPGPDPERMAAGVDRIQRALARVSTIRRSLSHSAKATDEAREHLDELANEVRAGLAELSAELDT